MASSVELWDVASGERILTRKVHEGLVWSVRYTPDGESLAYRVWGHQGATPLMTVHGLVSSVHHWLDFNPYFAATRQVMIDSEQFVHALAETNHQSGLADHPRRETLYVLQQRERARAP